MLEPEEGLVAKGVLRLGLADDGQVLDADAVRAIFVEAGLDGQDVAGRERHVDILLPSADADGALVDVEVGAHAVAGTVPVVEAVFLLEG